MTQPSVEWVGGFFRFRVFSKAPYQLQGWMGLPLVVDIDARCNEIGSLQFTLDTPERADLTDPDRRDEVELYQALTAEGARVVCDYLPLTSLPLITGMVTEWDDSKAGETRFTVTDDLVVLLYLLGWADPAHALNAQATDYYVASDPAEKVVKDLVTALLPHYPDINLTVAPMHTPPLGADVDVQIRFDKLADKLLPLMTDAGVRVVIYQDEAGDRVLDVIELGAYPIELTDENGIVEDWTYGMRSPTATDVIAGDSQVGADRVFTSKAADDAAARFGERIVVWVDASSAGDSGPSTEAKQDIALAGGRPKYVATVSLVETEDFEFGDTLPLGTQVDLVLGPHPNYTDRIRSVALHLDGGPDGLVVTPQVGDHTDDDGSNIAAALIRIDQLERR